jgi:hypothetical protein
MTWSSTLAAVKVNRYPKVINFTPKSQLTLGSSLQNILRRRVILLSSEKKLYSGVMAMNDQGSHGTKVIFERISKPMYIFHMKNTLCETFRTPQYFLLPEILYSCGLCVTYSHSSFFSIFFEIFSFDIYEFCILH